MNKANLLAVFFYPTLGFAGDILIADPFVPLAPKGVMAHAAYLQLTNSGDTTRSLIGVAAPDYAMAHIHLSSEQDGVATMTAQDQLDLKPGQTITLEPGGLHVMLMKPSKPLTLGGAVTFEMQFANGEIVPVTADVVERNGGS